jgi:hypothetical protein
MVLVNQELTGLNSMVLGSSLDQIIIENTVGFQHSQVVIVSMQSSYPIKPYRKPEETKDEMRKTEITSICALM